jgi:membrane-bound lytic murein transglycosylase B
MIRKYLTFFVLLSFATISSAAPYKGWGYVAERLRQDGVPPQALKAAFQSKQMPIRPFVPFGLHPKESHAMYRNFMDPEKITLARSFLKQHSREYTEAEKKFGVAREVINAILLVETQFGKIVGTHRVLERLARGASVAEEWNVKKNLTRLLKEGEKTNLNEVRARAKKVEQIFLPELRALFQIGARERINILQIRGSSAGAFGWPQFMPMAYLRFGVDGNRDGRVSLFDPADAIFSVAHYLSNNGWRNNASHREHLDVIWTYNKSTPYGETVLGLANKTAQF